MTLDTDAYEDDTKPREVPPGPYYRSRELRQVERAQLFRAVEQIDVKGYTLPTQDDGRKARQEKALDESRRAAVETTKHLSIIGAARALGVNRDTVRLWRRKFGGEA